MSVASHLGDSVTEARDGQQQSVARGRPRAGTYTMQPGDERLTGWHSHDIHQLVYALEGVAEVETATARYLLPPQQAVWIPAGIEHSTVLARANMMTVFFDPSMDLPAGDRVRILAAAPVIREMIRYAGRWPITRTVSDPLADAYFDVLAALVIEWLDHETPLCLPTSRDPLVANAMDYTNDHLADVTLNDVSGSVGASERTLRRAFVAETGMPWSRYLQESRLLKAMALLAEQGQNIITIAFTVGFDSVSAFNRAFRRYTGETPMAYRQRARLTQTAECVDEEPSRDLMREWSHMTVRPLTTARRRGA